jgi:hypothetical protein
MNLNKPHSKKVTALFLTGVIALVLTGCGSTKTPVASSPSQSATPSASPSNPYGAAPIDPPALTDPLLTVSKGSTSSVLTMTQLIALGTSDISIYEPFVKQRQTFTVIPLTKIFALASISGSDSVDTKALNDYVYTNTAAKFVAAKGYLAIKRNGLDIPFDQGGPIRIVFPDDSTWTKFLDPWNWSLSSISVK